MLSGNSPSIPRNKQIASIFKEAGVIEKYGSGIKRVRQTMKEAKAAAPQFEIIANFFKVTLFPSGVNGGVNGGVN
ncbi:MAG: AAA family ATPase, partial [Deltaproteobacteria bacterium]|nr:AAA family ATPase [Candidatus Tharpella aukensis]